MHFFDNLRRVGCVSDHECAQRLRESVISDYCFGKVFGVEHVRLYILPALLSHYLMKMTCHFGSLVHRDDGKIWEVGLELLGHDTHTGTQVEGAGVEAFKGRFGIKCGDKMVDWGSGDTFNSVRIQVTVRDPLMLLGIYPLKFE